MLKKAFKFAKLPILISMILTPIRFSLELIGLPEFAIFLIGLLWLTIAYSIYWGVKNFDESNPYKLLLLILVIFAPISRIPVFILWWIDTTWKIGTHYNIFTDWGQALVGQLFYGSLIQIIPGSIIGSIVLKLKLNKLQNTT
jgi:hypothetical protein